MSRVVPGYRTSPSNHLVILYLKFQNLYIVKHVNKRIFYLSSSKRRTTYNSHLTKDEKQQDKTEYQN